MALEQVLNGSAPASLVVVRGERPWALVREMLARSSGPILAIMVLHSPSVLGEQTHSANVTALDLSGAVAGYSDVDVGEAITNAVASLRPNTTVLLDAVDVLAEDLGSRVAFRLLRRVLSALSSTPSTSTLGGKGRLILPLPSASPFTSSVLSASFSPSLALLTQLSPRVVQATSTAYLLPADDERLPPLLEAAALRDSPLSSLSSSAPGEGEKIVVLVLLRKATGGAKGIVRSVEGLVQPGERRERWKVVGLGDVVEIKPQLEAKSTSHADLNLPFNLSLTDSQRAARGAVPLPYAHEGEGADLSMGMDWSDDEEDEEI